MKTKKKKATQPKGTVYLFHFSNKLSRAQHYLGFAEEGNLETRIKQHGTTAGAKLTFAAAQRGIGFELVRTWDDATRKVERALKNRKDAKSLCPNCAEERREAKRFYDAMRKLRARRIVWN
jgi:hypothetical protein